MAKDSTKGTVRGLERTIAEEGNDWPAELKVAAERALLSLKMMVGQEEQFAQSQALREAVARDLMDFASTSAPSKNTACSLTWRHRRTFYWKQERPDEPCCTREENCSPPRVGF